MRAGGKKNVKFFFPVEKFLLYIYMAYNSHLSTCKLKHSSLVFLGEFADWVNGCHSCLGLQSRLLGCRWGKARITGTHQGCRGGCGHPAPNSWVIGSRHWCCVIGKVIASKVNIKTCQEKISSCNLSPRMRLVSCDL